MLTQIKCQDVIRELSQKQKPCFVDIREREDFDKSHVPGAINIPQVEILELAPTYLPDRGRRLVLYGTSQDTESVRRAAEDLQKLGFLNLHYCIGGYDHWRQDGVRHETTALGFKLNFL